uniref:Retrotransposon Copia-like N-terminal domain-containing protein n=1 Tax=Opuntia streptacantha TaxID=393608 RepID=A0A7C8YQ79_OPUST
MQLVSTKLTGVNFQRWSRAVKIALRTKVKLGFIDGSCAMPDPASATYSQWIKCDYMVVSWLLNSIAPELADAFLYANSARELWDELTERFGQSNGPLLYQIQKEIEDLYQSNDSVAVYYTKLKKLWDELADLSESPVCTCTHNASCNALKRNLELDQRRKLMQFLMHLNDSYDGIRGQILLLDPLPPVNKAYSMIQRVEKQRQVTQNPAMLREVAATSHSIVTTGVFESESNAFLARHNPRGRRDIGRRNINSNVRSSLFCDNCQRNGHTRDKCFKLVGYPDWYEGLRDSTKAKKPARLAAHAHVQTGISSGTGLDTPLDDTSTLASTLATQSLPAQSSNDANSPLLQALAQEMMKLLQGKSSVEQPVHSPTAYAHFAGPFN